MNESDSPAPKKRSSCFFYGCGCVTVILILFLLVCLASLWNGRSSDPDSSSKEYTEEFLEGNAGGVYKIAVIDINGIIMNQRSPYASSIADSEDICKQIKKAEKDGEVRAVILNLNTPGGEVTAADDIHHAVSMFRKRTGKPVIALMNSIAASGGYYVAAACSRIVSGKLTMTGSIGVIISTYNYKGLFDKIGVSSEVYKSGEMKDMLNGARQRTPRESALVQELVDECYSEFVRLVAAGRRIPESRIRNSEIGDGRVIHGKRALELGLVDEIGRMKEALAAAEKLSGSAPDSLKAVRYKRNFSFLDILFGASSAVRPQIQIRMPSVFPETELPRGRIYFLPEQLIR